MEWIKASDIAREIDIIVSKLDLTYIDCKRIICLRSFGSTSRARARIWSFPRIWQLALSFPACYIIEVLEQHFDRLSSDEKQRVLIHELLHIPKNFSGSLLPHRGRARRIDSRCVEKLFTQLKNK